MIFQTNKKKETGSGKHILHIDEYHACVKNFRNLRVTIPSETFLVQMHMQNLNESRK